MARLKKYSNEIIYNLPIYGGGADIVRGSFMKVGATPATDGGLLVQASGASAIPDIVGILNTMLDYSVDGQSLIAGTAFVTKPVELVSATRILEIEYDLTGASACLCTQAVTTTAMTVTNLEDDIDGAFVYTVDGTGKGQTNYLTASTGGACTLKAAFGTSLFTDTYFIKILPRFHDLISLSTDGTKLASQVAVGAVKGMVIDSWIERNGRREPLSPVKHAALTGLTGIRSVKFGADIAIRDSFVYTVD